MNFNIENNKDSSWWWWWFPLDCMSSRGNRLREDSYFPGVCPAWDCCSFPITVEVSSICHGGGQSLEGVGLGIWIQVLALCMSIVINSLVIFCVCMHAKSLQSCLTLCDPMDCSPPVSRFSRQECWSGLPFPSPGESSWPRAQTHVSCISCIGFLPLAPITFCV